MEFASALDRAACEYADGRPQLAVRTLSATLAQGFAARARADPCSARARALRRLCAASESNALLCERTSAADSASAMANAASRFELAEARDASTGEGFAAQGGDALRRALCYNGAWAQARAGRRLEAIACLAAAVSTGCSSDGGGGGGGGTSGGGSEAEGAHTAGGEDASLGDWLLGDGDEEGDGGGDDGGGTGRGAGRGAHSAGPPGLHPGLPPTGLSGVLRSVRAQLSAAAAGLPPALSVDAPGLLESPGGSQKSPGAPGLSAGGRCCLLACARLALWLLVPGALPGSSSLIPDANTGNDAGGCAEVSDWLQWIGWLAREHSDETRAGGLCIRWIGRHWQC
ncbi:hypothetical protein T492DRAFT_906232 [Pavlovales sp. CCMP2436]|nr:hypothetical protein T492DRAFT_906232 [Pavlovales sp. CCMP2436]